MEWARHSFDVHVHAGPSLFERWGDAWQLAQACHDAEMAGFVLKAHHGSTVELAAILDSRFEALKIFGGVTLNLFVGGLNPYAVECALRLGGKMIWLPTIHADNHGQRCGCLGGFGFQTSKVQKVPETGLRIVDDNGIVEPLQEILALLHDQPVVLATGHVSPEEIFALVRCIEQNGWKIRLLLNHVFFKAPGFSPEQLRELVRPWIWFETVYLSISPMVACVAPEAIAASMLELDGARWVMATDSGQKANPPSPTALAMFANALESHGVPRSRLKRMLQQEPRELLCLS